jgi:hypothetical protein
VRVLPNPQRTANVDVAAIGDVLEETGLLGSGGRHEGAGHRRRAVEPRAVEDLYRVRELLELSAVDTVNETTALMALAAALADLDDAAHHASRPTAIPLAAPPTEA